MKFYDEQLQKLQEQIARKRQLEAQVSELRAQRSTLSAHVRELEDIKMQEQADVDKLEGRSLAAFFYNVIGIPLAGGAWYPLWHLKLNPMFGAAAMSLSSFCVVTNALRLNLFKLHDAAKDKKIKKKHHKEVKPMEKTMKIEGMMCPHCEARVKKTLEAIDGVIEAEVSHEAGTAIVTMDKPVADDVLRQAIEAQDYPVLSIE